MLTDSGCEISSGCETWMIRCHELTSYPTLLVNFFKTHHKNKHTSGSDDLGPCPQNVTNLQRQFGIVALAKAASTNERMSKYVLRPEARRHGDEATSQLLATDLVIASLN